MAKSVEINVHDFDRQLNGSWFRIKKECSPENIKIIKKYDTEMIREPVRRGRKHKFGIVCITHRPSDISPAVENLCNTKIAFRSSSCKTWISNNFGKEFVYEIETLETGICYISTMKTSKQIQAKISVPFVGKIDDGYEN